MNKSSTVDNKKEHRINLLKVHLSTVFFGASGLIGKQALSVWTVSLMRGLFSDAFLLILMITGKEDFRLKRRKDALLMIGAGVFLTLNWVLFIRSIQISTVAVGTLCCAATPIFLTFAEPVLFKEKITRVAIISTVITVAGLLLLVPAFTLDNTITKGIVLGVIGAVCYGIFTLFNRDLTVTYSGTKVAFFEHSVVTLILLPTLFITGITFSMRDIPIFIISGVVLTALPHILFIAGQKTVSAQTGGIIAGMESVYGILLAMLFFREYPDVRTIAGAALIIFATIYSCLRSEKIEHKPVSETTS